MWSNKPIDMVFKYFGYDMKRQFSSDEEKAKVRASAIERMKTYGQLPDEVMDKVISYNDNQIATELRDKERKEAERRRVLEMRRTMRSNRENDVWADDDYVKALYLHLVSEGEVEDIDSETEEVEELKETLQKHETKLERLLGSGDNSLKVTEMITNLEIKIDEIKSNIDDLEDTIESNDVYGVLYELQWSHYGLRSFSFNDSNEYAVGTEEESEDAGKEYLSNMIDDEGPEVFSSWVLESNIDEERLKSDVKDSYVEYFNDDVRYDLSAYFEDYDEDDEETHPDDEDIENLVDGMAEDRADELVSDLDELKANGWDIKDYVDIDGLIYDVINADGLGHTLSSYDGTEYTEIVNDKYYNIYRVN